MRTRRISAVFASATLLLCPLALADKTPANPKMSDAKRMLVIRGLNAEAVFIRRVFPMGTVGLTIKDGKITPDEAHVQSLIASYGPSVKPGDRARITNVVFKGDDKIIFEINGGPRKKVKWWERIQIGVGSGNAQLSDPNDPRLNARGSWVTLAFDKYVPDLSIDQIKDMLRPVFDFNATSAAQAYMDTLPPKLKQAIKEHEVLVGMNREMVVYAKGRPPQKYRDKDGTVEYEEWIYGTPPQEIQFVRFVGDEVVRLEIMKVDGQKVVRTDKEINLEKPTVAEGQAPQQPAAGDQPQPTTTKAPTLRRPGEDPVKPVDGGGRMPLPDNTGPPGSDPKQGPPQPQTPVPVQIPPPAPPKIPN